MRVRAVRLDRRQVVGAVGVDDGACGIAVRVRGVVGEYAAGGVDVLGQRVRRGGLAVRAAARERATAVGVRRRRPEVDIVVRAPVDATDALAVGGERRQVRVLGEPNPAR